MPEKAEDSKCLGKIESWIQEGDKEDWNISIGTASSETCCYQNDGHKWGMDHWKKVYEHGGR